MGCHTDPRAVKKEDQFQEQSLSEGSVLLLLNLKLTVNYQDLYIWNAGFDGPCQSDSFRRIRFIQFSIVIRDRAVTESTVTWQSIICINLIKFAHTFGDCHVVLLPVFVNFSNASNQKSSASVLQQMKPQCSFNLHQFIPSLRVTS